MSQEREICWRKVCGLSGGVGEKDCCQREVGMAEKKEMRDRREGSGLGEWEG